MVNSSTSPRSKSGSPREKDGASQSMSPALACIAILMAFLMGRSLQAGFNMGNEGVHVETTLEQMLKDFRAPSTPKKRGFENLERIQRILKANQTWAPFARLKEVNGTKIQNMTEDESIDVTRNHPRIEDYGKPHVPHDSTSEATRNLKDDKDQKDESQRDKKQNPLNIMFLYADDWTMNVLGALNKDVLTPNIDGMAERGMLFTRNCVTTSVCWISRSTMVTGTYAAVHKHLSVAGEQLFNGTTPWLETLYPLLKSNGYYTGLVGKWHAPSPQAFTDSAFDFKKGYFGKHWYPRGDGKLRHVTDLNGEHALEFLKKRPKNKLFALTVAFYATHALDNDFPPFQPMNETMALYKNVTIQKPKTATDEHWKRMPWFFTERNVARGRNRRRFDAENFQDQIKNLYRMATEVDSVVGAIIDELKAQGVYNNTLLIFTTDNGVFRGEHGLAEKWYPFEESVRVPLVIEDPRMPKNFVGTRNDEFTLSVDLAPTMLSAAGIPVPKRMQGRDIAQLYLDHNKAMSTWRQDFFYEWAQGNPYDAVGHPPYYQIPAVFALIRKDYKYFYWPQVKYEQLFNIEEDPYEEQDIWNSTAQTTKEALNLMKARYNFMKSWAQSGNPV